MEEKKNDLVEIYQSESRSLELSVDGRRDTILATRAQMCILFKKDQSVIFRHLKSIFKTSELDEKSNAQKMHIAN